MACEAERQALQDAEDLLADLQDLCASGIHTACAAAGRQEHAVEAARHRLEHCLAPPPVTAPPRLAVPAYWTLDAKYTPYWQMVQQTNSAVAVTVIEQSWPGTAKNNPMWKNDAQAMLNSLPGAVLGYVSTRNGAGNPILDIDEILGGITKVDSVQAWYDQFGQQIDGVYFDELVVPDDPAAVGTAQALVAKFKMAHPTGKVMILAGACLDEAVVGAGIDWALLWEDRFPAYRDNFTAMQGVTNKPIPSWWKNRAYRQKIVHLVHDCAEPDRQHALGLANERNAGVVFVMDQRGKNMQGADVFYDHLPPYWTTEVREINSYDDFGFDPELALRAAHRYGVSQNALHAWPNFEAAWYNAQHVRGTFVLDPGPHAQFRDVPVADLPGSPPLFDISAVWSAAHQYAQAQGFETALPTFEQANYGKGPVYGMILLATGLPWLIPDTVALADTYEKPTFAEPGSVIRNINRVLAGHPATKAAFCTFVPDNPSEPRGRTAQYNCYVLDQSAPVSWRDVPTNTYISLL